MKNSIRLMICMILLLAAMAAAQQPPTKLVEGTKPEATSTGTAKCFLYRHRLYRGSAVRIGIFIDNVQAANLVNGRWVALNVPSGHHTINPKDNQSGLEMDLEAGKSYYVLASWGEEGLFHSAHKIVTLIAPEQGAFEIKQLKPLDDKDISWPSTQTATVADSAVKK